MHHDQPNVLLIVTDQEQSWTTLPAALKLPAHERLRERGTSFNRFHVNCSPCGPSRSNLYTGHHVQHTHMHVNPDNPPQPQLPTDLPTIGHLFRNAGYRTIYKGKWHLSEIAAGRDLHSQQPNIYIDATNALQAYGFGEYNFFGDVIGYAWDGYRNDATIAGSAALALKKLSQDTADTRPWLMAVNFVNPHDIMFFDATGNQNDTRQMRNFICRLMGAPADALYQEDLGFDLPASFYQEQPDEKPEMHTFLRQRQNMFYGDLPIEDIENWRRFRNYYFNCIRDVDRHLATVLDALESTGLDDRTVIVFTSDHGERAGAHGLQQKAGTAYEEEAAVPLVIVHPDVTGGVATEALGSMIDIAPTLLALAGINQPALDMPLPGFDLSGVVNSSGARTGRDEIGSLLNYTGTFHWQRRPDAAPDEPHFDLTKRRLFRGIVWDRYKFVRYFAPAEHHTPTQWTTLLAHNDLELYDLSVDPGEMSNLAVQPEVNRTLIETLNARVNSLIAHEVGDDLPSDYDGEIKQYLLGA